jgi:hypothetical protein
MISYEKQTNSDQIRREGMFRECNDRIPKVEIMWKQARLEVACSSLRWCRSDGGYWFGDKRLF